MNSSVTSLVYTFSEIIFVANFLNSPIALFKLLLATLILIFEYGCPKSAPPLLELIISAFNNKIISTIYINKLQFNDVNDFVNYPDDSFENMIKFSKDNNFNFPYLHDDTQEIAKSYDAVCTPDFFGYNKNLELQYRGRLRELKNFVPVKDGESDLLKSMKQIAETGNGPQNQIPSAGCGIKWKYD